jgi:hypothetical protein
MSENKETPLSSISKASTLEGIGEFWDTHSLGDYWDQTYEVEFEITATRKRRVTLDPEVYAGVEAEAKSRGIMPETLINLWLMDRLQDRRPAELVSSD